MYIESKVIVYEDEKEMNEHAHEMILQGWNYTYVQRFPNGSTKVEWFMYDRRKWTQYECMIQ